MADVTEWPKPSPITMAMLRACETMLDSRLATTIPVGELRQFSEALLAAYGVVVGPSLREALQTLRNAAEGVKFVALKPQLYHSAQCSPHADKLVAALQLAERALALGREAPGLAQERAAFDRWYLDEHGVSALHGEPAVDRQFRLWCAARGVKEDVNG